MKNIQHYPIFADEALYLNQIKWLIKQIENGNDDSFKNFREAESKLEKISIIQLGKGSSKKQLQCNLKLAEKNLHGFRNSYLSNLGFNKLNTTLKVAKKRLSDKEKGAKKIDVTISNEAFKKLNDIANKTGLTKTAIIEKLLLSNDENSDMTTFTGSHDKLKTITSDPDNFELPKKGSLKTKTTWRIYNRFAQIKAGIVMRHINGGEEHTVSGLDGKTILFDDGSELDAYKAKRNYEIKASGVK